MEINIEMGTLILNTAQKLFCGTALWSLECLFIFIFTTLTIL